jgi:hypothetical protein
MFNTDAIFFPKSFKLKLVESEHVDPTDTEDRLYISR